MTARRLAFRPGCCSVTNFSSISTTMPFVGRRVATMAFGWTGQLHKLAAPLVRSDGICQTSYLRPHALASQQRLTDQTKARRDIRLLPGDDDGAHELRRAMYSPNIAPRTRPRGTAAVLCGVPNVCDSPRGSPIRVLRRSSRPSVGVLQCNVVAVERSRHHQLSRLVEPRKRVG